VLELNFFKYRNDLRIILNVQAETTPMNNW